jgi:hypothetical protein
MSFYAILNNKTGGDGFVLSLKSADRPADNGWIDISDIVPKPEIGSFYVNGAFFANTSTSLPKDKFITRGMFKLRMTQAERIATRVLALSGTPEGMVAMDFNDLLSDVPVVDLDQQEVIDGMRFLESVGVLDEGRASEIVGAEITSREKP